MNIDIDYDLLADKIAKRLKPITTENLLWDTKECADYLRVSRTHFANVISKKPGFPKPCGPASENKAYMRKRWHKGHIIAWATPKG